MTLLYVSLEIVLSSESTVAVIAVVIQVIFIHKRHIYINNVTHWHRCGVLEANNPTTEYQVKVHTNWSCVLTAGG